MRDTIFGLLLSCGLLVLRGLPRPQAVRPRKSRGRFRPALEGLETRLAPAVPTALNQLLTVLPNPMVKHFRPEFTDPDGPTSSYTFTVVSGPDPAKGTLVRTGQDWTYTPKPGVILGDSFRDSFTWRVNDGSGNSNTATITIRPFQVHQAYAADYINQPEFSSVFPNKGFQPAEQHGTMTASGPNGHGIGDHDPLPSEADWKQRVRNFAIAKLGGVNTTGLLMIDIEALGWDPANSATARANRQQLTAWAKEELPNARVAHYSNPFRAHSVLQQSHKDANDFLKPLGLSDDWWNPSEYAQFPSWVDWAKRSRNIESEALRVYGEDLFLTKPKYVALEETYNTQFDTDGDGDLEFVRPKVEEHNYLFTLQAILDKNYDGVILWGPQHNTETWTDAVYNTAKWQALRKFLGIDAYSREITVTGNNGADIADNSTSPSLSNHTDFGSVAVSSGSVERTFTIQHTGTDYLTLGLIKISGQHAADFTVTQDPSLTGPFPPWGGFSGATERRMALIADGQTTTFKIKFDPSAAGTRRATVSFFNSDASEALFNFDIWGNFTGGSPEIDVQGGNPLVSIPDGDTTPSPLTGGEGTDFGSVNVTSGMVTRTFTVQNTGTATLTLGSVTFSGTGAADFSVTTPPAASVAAGGSTTFSVTFNPSVTGLRTATLSFSNNDTDENPYNFAIQGTGTSTSGDITTGLKGYWKLNETGTATAAADSSGSGLTGTLTSFATSPSPWVTGRVGGGLSFDGSNDYVNIGNPTALQFTGAMTLAAWVKVDAFTNGHIITKTAATGHFGWALSVRTNDVARFQISGDGDNQIWVESGVLPSGQWTHLVGVYEPGVALRLYVNGVLDASNTTSIPSLQHNSDRNVRIGFRPDGASGTAFDGTLDEVRSYNRALSATDVTALYNFAGPQVAQGGAAPTGGGAPLTEAVLRPVVAEAVARWTAAGADPAVLAGASFVIADLPDDMLGQAAGAVVWVDVDAAGYGWFVDATPGEDSEFGHGFGSAGMDLLTTVSHELGHLLGLPDIFTEGNTSLMSGTLPTGTRRLPTAVEAQQIAGIALHRVLEVTAEPVNTGPSAGDVVLPGAPWLLALLGQPNSEPLGRFGVEEGQPAGRPGDDGAALDVASVAPDGMSRSDEALDTASGVVVDAGKRQTDILDGWFALGDEERQSGWLQW